MKYTDYLVTAARRFSARELERARPLLESAMQLSEWQIPGLDYIPDPESTGLRLEDKIKQLLSELEP